MMNLVVPFLCLLGAAYCLPWNHPKPVEDTPEVAAAKAAHLEAIAQAKQEALLSKNKKQNTIQPTSQTLVRQPEPIWTGNENTLSAPQNGPWATNQAYNTPANSDPRNSDDGSWKDDELWKNYDDGSWKEEYNSVDDGNQQQEKPQVNSDGEKRWTGPIALPPGYDENGAPLPVQDTPEVAAAKAKHLQAYARAASPGKPIAAERMPVTAAAPRNRPPVLNAQEYTNPRIVQAIAPLASRAPSHRSRQPAPIYESPE
ncbi:Hypothetical protein NTJ_09743 [Nesidiocoris tenuis]|uniref:Uncharacterized protein n=1 Tax=Nesidiocoris tenuis TaxID=355587 RepID=A0ABN7B027_9HEMI|nr:Hypothetical protein NTJ_09743 [Nesidiocoris tenuis]